MNALHMASEKVCVTMAMVSVCAAILQRLVTPPEQGFLSAITQCLETLQWKDLMYLS